MKIKSLFNAKVYFSRITLWVSMAIVLVVTIFASIIYFKIDSSMMEKEYQNNKKILSQVKYNIDMMNSMVSNFSLTLFQSNEVAMIMNTRETEDNLMDFIHNMDRLKKIVGANSHVKSIYIYNNFNGKYSSENSGIYCKDTILNDMTNNLEIVPKQLPVLRKLRDMGTNRLEDVFTYIFYDSVSRNKKIDGAFVVNVKASWIFDNISIASDIDKEKGDKIYLMDKQGNFIDNTPNTSDNGFKETLKTEYQEFTGENNLASGIYKIRFEGREYITSFISVKSPEWIIFKTQPVDSLFSFINQVKISIVVITLIFIIVSFIVSISVSRVIYRPLGILVKKVVEKQPKSLGIDKKNDEFAFLDSVFNKSVDQINNYEIKRRSESEIIKSYYLRKLILDSSSAAINEFGKVNSSVSLTEFDEIVICLLSIDDYNDFCGKTTPSERELYKFAIINVISEVISRGFTCEAVDMKNDQIAVVLNVMEADGFYEKIAQMIKETQDFIEKYYSVSFTMTVGDIIRGGMNITRSYNTTVNNSLYRYVYGKKSVITNILVKQNIEHSDLIDYSFPMEKRLVAVIKTGNIERIKECLNDIFSELSKLSYNNIILCIFHLIQTINSLVRDIYQFNSRNSDLKLMVKELLEFETIEQLAEKLNEFFEEFCRDRKSSINDKHEMLVEAIKNIVNVNYADATLCLQKIGDSLNMSPAHVGRVFKDYTHFSITEYMQEVRMNKALALLEESRYNIGEISVRVGIENITYFYKLFKKRFGVAPKEYAQKKLIKFVE